MIGAVVGRRGGHVDAAFLWVAAGALAAGFVTGLAGFGVGIVALGFWLHVMEPVVAGPLVAICSVAGQVRSIVHVRRAISVRRVLPFVIGGAMGIPLGVFLLNFIDAADLKVGLGMFLIAYSLFGLVARPGAVFADAGPFGDGAVGFGGGIFGGIAGLSGPLVTVWCGLRGWAGDAQRATWQPYNLSVLTLVVAAYASQELLTREVGLLTLISVPALLVGVQLGLMAYRRVDESGFRRTVLILLLASGTWLVANNVLADRGGQDDKSANGVRDFFDVSDRNVMAAPAGTARPASSGAMSRLGGALSLNTPLRGESETELDCLAPSARCARRAAAYSV